MRPVTTIILIALAAAAAGFMLLVDRHQPTSGQAAERARVVLKWPVGEITGVEITNAAGRFGLARSADGSWRLTPPVDDRADGVLVAEILKLAGSTEVIERLPADELKKKGALKDFGLDAGSQIKLVFKAPGRTPAVLVVGKPAAFEDSAYIKIDSGDDAAGEVVLAHTKSRDLLARAAGDFRDPKLLRSAPEKIVRLSLRSGNEDVELARTVLVPAAGDDPAHKPEPSPWRLTRPIQERADRGMMEALLAGLATANATGFVESRLDPPDAAGDKGVRVMLWTSAGATEPAETLDIMPGPDETTALVRSSERPALAKVSSDLLALRRAGVSQFRDNKLASIDPRRVTTMIVKDSRAGVSAMHAFRNRWFLVRDQWVYEASRDRIQNLIKTLNEADIIPVSDDPAELPRYGLDHPELELTVGWATHPERAKPVAATPQNSQTLRITEAFQYFYANWEGSNAIYRIFDPRWLGEIPRESIQYKSPALLNFSLMAVQRVIIALDPDPPIELNFTVNGSHWTAKRGDKEVTPYLDLTKVGSLINELSRLSAGNWCADPRPGLEALKNPALRISITIEQHDDVTGGEKPLTFAVALASTAPGQRTALYYGRLNEEPDVFTIRRDLFELLAAPVLKHQVIEHKPEDAAAEK